LELLKVTGRETNERKKLYGVLYKGYFYLFKPHHRTSVSIETKKFLSSLERFFLE